MKLLNFKNENYPVGKGLIRTGYKSTFNARKELPKKIGRSFQAKFSLVTCPLHNFHGCLFRRAVSSLYDVKIVTIQLI